MPKPSKISSLRHPYLEPVVNTPYFAARQERQDRQLKILSAGKLWRGIAVLTLLSNIALAVGMVIITQMRKETPFVIAVDKWGYTVPIGKATPVTLETYTQFHIKEFVRLARSISIDTFALEANIKRAYTLVKKPSQAFNYLNAYYNEDQKPFEKAKQYSVFVEDISLIKVSEHTFRARWTETVRTLSGHALTKDNYWGEFTYRLHPAEKQDPSERDANPLSLKIEKLDWARE